MGKILAIGGVLLLGVGLWAAGQNAKDAGDAEKGKEVFDQCAACHNADSDEKKMGPGLKGLYKKAKLKNGKAPSDATVSEIVNKGGNGMPAYAELLSDEEKSNLLAYLHTL